MTPWSTGPWLAARAPPAPRPGNSPPRGQGRPVPGRVPLDSWPHGHLCRQLSGHMGVWGGQVRARPSTAVSARPEPNPVQMPWLWGGPTGGPTGDGPCSGAWGQASLGQPTHVLTAQGPGGWVRGPASRFFVTPRLAEHPHHPRHDEGVPEKEASLHTQGAARARRRMPASGRLSREAGAPRMRVPWDEPLGSHGKTWHAHPLSPRNPLWGFPLGQDAGRRKMAGRRAGRGRHPKRSLEGDEDGWTEVQLRGSRTL